MSLVPVDFKILPPYSSISTVVKKIKRLSTRPWGNTVTLQNIELLFDHHLNQLISEAIGTIDLKKICKLVSPLRTIVSLLCQKFQNTPQWSTAQNVALHALAVMHSLESFSLPRKKPFKNVTQEILVHMFDSLMPAGHGNLRSVCKTWRNCADTSYNKYSKKSWVSFYLNLTKSVVVNIRTLIRLNPDCKLLDLTSVNKNVLPGILIGYPQLQKLVITAYPKFMISVAMACPHIEELSVDDTHNRDNVLILSDLLKLKKVELIGARKNCIQFPGSIKSISIDQALRLSFQSLVVPENARVKHLSITNSDIGRTLDLQSPCWCHLETLMLINCAELETIILPPQMDKLCKIFVENCRSLTHFDLSHTSCLSLESLTLNSVRYFILPLYPSAPKLNELFLSDIEMQVDILLDGYQDLRFIRLYDLTGIRFSVPESVVELDVIQCRFLSTQLDRRFQFLEILIFNKNSGVQEVLSLEDSTQLEYCNITKVTGLTTIILPRTKLQLEELEVFQKAPLTIIINQNNWPVLEELNLSAAPLQLTKLDLSDASMLETLMLTGAENLEILQLPENTDRLDAIQLVGVSFVQIDLSPFNNLESIHLETTVECEVFLGKHPHLLNRQFSNNITTHGAPKKKRKKDP
jgi:hypothetical protein